MLSWHVPTNMHTQARYEGLGSRSNGAAERMVQTFKQAYKASAGLAQLRVEQFLMKYRSTARADTGCAPSESLLGRRIRTGLDLLRPTPAPATLPPATSLKEFSEGDLVWFTLDSDHRRSRSPGIIVRKRGHYMYIVRAENAAETVVRHADQLRRRQVMPYTNGNQAASSPSRDIDPDSYITTAAEGALLRRDPNPASSPAASPDDNEQLASDASNQGESTLLSTQALSSAVGNDGEQVPTAAAAPAAARAFLLGQLGDSPQNC